MTTLFINHKLVTQILILKSNNSKSFENALCHKCFYMAHGHKMSIKYPLCTILLLLVAMHQCKVDMTSKVQEGDLGQKPCRYILSTT